MLAWLRNLVRPFPKASFTQRGVRFLRGRYDAAVTTGDNRRHWKNADGLSANAANSPEVRRTLRNRSRYEIANNSYAKGVVLTLANDVIGTGPRLQLLTEDSEANRRIESEFMRWARACRLAEKLRTMRMAKAQDGEAFALRWFTPAVEVDLCGHATLASAHVLWENGHLPPDAPAVFETNSVFALPVSTLKRWLSVTLSFR